MTHTLRHGLRRRHAGEPGRCRERPRVPRTRSGARRGLSSRGAATPPYSATQVDIERVPGGPERDRRSRRGAAGDSYQRRAGGGDDADAGADEELALGFCLSEGMQPAGAAVPDDLAANTVDVDAPGFDPERLRRSFYVSSSCGVCGKGAIEAVAVEAQKVESDLRVPAPLLLSLPDRLREAQGAFAATGGLHAAGLFDRRRHAAVRARGRRPPQRGRQGARLGLPRRASPARRRPCSA